MTKGVVLGLAQGTGTPVVLSEEARSLSLYVIGTPGSGKSTLLENVALQDMHNGDGLCFIDPHGESADRLLHAVPPVRRDDVIFWNPRDYTHPLGLNPFECDPDDPVAVSQRVQGFVSAFESLAEFSDVFAQGVRMRDMLHNVGYAFAVNQGRSLLEALDFLSAEAEEKGKTPPEREAFYPRLKERNEVVWKYWQRFEKLSPYVRQERIEATANKLRRFASDPIMQSIFGQKQNSINFREVIDEGRIIILKLSGVGDYNAAFIGAFVIWELWQAAMLRGKSSKVRPFHIIADEFENYMTLAFPMIQNQGRGFKLDATIAHQERSGLEVKLKGSTKSVKNRVVFLTSGADAAELAQEFKKEKAEAHTHQQQKYVYATDLLDHLASRGHEREAVVTLHRTLVTQMGHLFGFAQVQRDREEQVHANARSQEIQLPPLKANYTQTVGDAKKLLEGEASAILYTAMTAPTKEALQAHWEAQGGIERSLTVLLDTLYTKLFTVVDQLSVGRLREREWPALQEALLRGAARTAAVEDIRGFLWKRGATLWGWEQGMRVLLYQLGEALREIPCFVRSGQLETVIEKERPIKDIQDELADVVASQRFRTALVSVIEELEPVQYVVEIERLVPSDVHQEARAQAEEIIRRCQRDYGQAGQESSKAVNDQVAYQAGTIPEVTPTELEQPADRTREEVEEEIILVDEVRKRVKKV